MSPLRRTLILLAILPATFSTPSSAGSTADEVPPSGQARASIDLATVEGVRQVAGSWRYSDARIIEAPFAAPGTDGQPTGSALTTFDIEPRAGSATFDDSSWELLDPTTLDRRRSTGRVCFAWYRIRLTIPQRIRDFDPNGSTVVFETSVDDYAEVWVDGELPRLSGQTGGSVVGGWNAANRLIIGRHVRPGQSIQLAVFAMNGPISDPPTNFIYMRRAVLEFHQASTEPVAIAPREVNVKVVRLDPGINDIVSSNPKLFKLAEGFDFTEGPLWLPVGDLLFSDPNANRIYRLSGDGRLEVFREQSGYAGDDVRRYHQPGSNGLALDPAGRLTIAEHGNRRVTRLEPDQRLTVLADRYRGKRFNSPNDLVYRSDGSLYFSDPPFGLPGVYSDPGKELAFSGVYRWHDGQLELLTDELAGPNGVAFSPDERYLYVGNWDPKQKVVMRYELGADGAIVSREPFFDLTAFRGEEAIDGVKVDRRGNVYVSGPGGLWIVAADGRPLGRIEAPRQAANFAWGGDQGNILYLTARDRLYRMPLLTEGFRSTPSRGAS